MLLKGKVALITGGGEGIGAATCRLFAREGAKVGVLGRSEDNISDVAEAIRKEGGEAVPLQADISRPEEMQQAAHELVERYGRLDIVFAHAGINGVWAPVEELKPEEFQKTIDINLNGTFYTIQASAPHLKKNGGSVIVTSSVNGTRIFTNTGATAYSASKAGQVAIAKMLAIELAKHRIRVNVICPGAIDTEIDQNTTTRHLDRIKEPVEFPEGSIPLTDGQPGKPEDCADLALFLASEKSKHISGAVVFIDGAQSLLEG